MTEAVRGEKQSGCERYIQLLRDAQANPFSKDRVESFFKEYEDKRDNSDDDRQTYLMLRCLHDGFSAKWLNDLAEIHIRRGEFFVGLMCLLDSLRLNPGQPEVIGQIERLWIYRHPKLLEPKDGTRCTVSVIMAAFNRPAEMREAIQSVLNQTFADFELIVVNDGGSGEIEKAVRSFDSDKIRYIRLEHNTGQAAATNTGISQSWGKYIAYLDDDDVYYPNHLQLLVEALDNTSARVAYTNTNAVDGEVRDGKFLRTRKRWVWNQDYDRDKLVEKIFVTDTVIMHHRDLLAETGLFREDLWMSMDWELWLRLALKSDFVHLNRDTCEYRFRTDNICRRNLYAAHFFGRLVSNYHKYHQGDLACAKYYLYSGDRERAGQTYQTVKSNYEAGFKTVGLIEDLLDMARQFGDRRFFRRLSVDYFKRAPRTCLKKAAGTKSARMLAAVFPLVPGRAIKTLAQRILRYGKKILKKSAKAARPLSWKLKSQFSKSV